MINLMNQFLGGILIFLVGFLWIKLRKNSIPGPIPLPVIGNVLQIGHKPHVRFAEWKKIYGPLFKVKMGAVDTVIVSNPKLIKELLSENAASGRSTDNPIIYEFSKGPYGVILSEGESWEAQRRFTLRTLRDFGFSKRSMEGLIMDEVEAMLKWFRREEGVPISGNRIFNAPVVNSLWRIVSNERHKWEDHKPAILEVATELFDALAVVCTNGLLFAPILRFIAPDFFGWNRYVKSTNDMFDMISKSVEKHRMTLDSNCPRDLIDHHLVAIDACTDPQSSLWVNLLSGVVDLFVGGSETTSHTLSWALLYLNHYQNAQKKLQMEIDSVIGTSRLPCLSDKNKMPYLEATTFETLRLSTVLSMGVARRMLSSKQFYGYTLKKGTTIFANLYAVHHDPDIWGDPFVFKPERFLSEDGKKVIGHEALIPFSNGVRKCIGATLAKDTLFLFLSSIFQQFHIHGDPEIKDKNAHPYFEPDIGYFLVPKPFKVILLSRTSD